MPRTAEALIGIGLVHTLDRRDEEGAWTRLEAYIQERTSARFSHGSCPDCAKEYR